VRARRSIEPSVRFRKKCHGDVWTRKREARCIIEIFAIYICTLGHAGAIARLKSPTIVVLRADRSTFRNADNRRAKLPGRPDYREPTQPNQRNAIDRDACDINTFVAGKCRRFTRENRKEYTHRRYLERRIAKATSPSGPQRRRIFMHRRQVPPCLPVKFARADMVGDK